MFTTLTKHKNNQTHCCIALEKLKKIRFCLIIIYYFSYIVQRRKAGWAIAHPVFGRIEGAAGRQRHATLLLAHPVLGSHLRPCSMKSTTTSQNL